MKQLISGEEAEVTMDQHEVVCSDCPFSRKSIRGWLGNTSAEEWMQVAHGEGSADCHALTSEDGPWACAGLAIYRANVCKLSHDPDALKLPANRKTVFSNRKEFLDHHAEAQS